MMGANTLGDVSDMLTMCNRTRTLVVETNKNVVVTAFESPFEGYAENPSAVVLDKLMKAKIEDIEIHPKILKSTFQDIDEKLPSLRETYPDQVFHLAAHKVANTIYLESKAFSEGYRNPDLNNHAPNEIPQWDHDDRKVIENSTNFDELIHEVTKKCGLDGQKYGGLKVEKSSDPGRFVGGYLYYLSIREGVLNTLMIHVPPFEGKCTKEAVTNVIREIISVLTKEDC